MLTSRVNFTRVKLLERLTSRVNRHEYCLLERLTLSSKFYTSKITRKVNISSKQTRVCLLEVLTFLNRHEYSLERLTPRVCLLEVLTSRVNRHEFRNVNTSCLFTRGVNISSKTFGKVNFTRVCLLEVLTFRKVNFTRVCLLEVLTFLILHVSVYSRC